MRKIKITEEQYNTAIAEGVKLSADVSAANGDVAKAVDTAKSQAQKSGVNLSDATIEIPATTESRLFTIKQLKEARLKNMKKNSEYYSVDEFIKHCYKKK